jgi:hypothetical protein
LAGRDLLTSGDYLPPPAGTPLAVTAIGAEPPDGARFRVTTDEVAWFTDHRPAFDWQAVNGGKLRTA